MAIVDFNRWRQAPKMVSPRPVRHSVRPRPAGDDPVVAFDPNGESASLVDDEDGIVKVAGLQRAHDAWDIAVAPDEDQAPDDDDLDDEDDDDDDEFEDDEDGGDDEDDDEADEAGDDA